MTPSTFLQHWGIYENPFRGEEARQDTVFCRITATDSAQIASATEPVGERPTQHSPLASAAQHAELEKFIGDFHRPASSVVFGEKGSGKTAMRLQLAQAAAVHNTKHAADRVLLVAYDELHPMLERLHNRLRRVTRKGETTLPETLRQIRLVDHIDAIMHMVVPRVVDAVLAPPPTDSHAGPAMPKPPHLRGLADPETLDLGPEPKKVLRKTDPAIKRDLLAMAAAYDRSEDGGARVRPLRWALQVRRPLIERVEAGVAYFGWIPPTAIALWLALTAPKALPNVPASPPPVPLSVPVSVPVSVPAATGVPSPSAGADDRLQSAPAESSPGRETAAPGESPAGAPPGSAPSTPAGSTSLAPSGSSPQPQGDLATPAPRPTLQPVPRPASTSAQSVGILWRQLQETFGLTGASDPRTIVWTTAFVSLMLIWILFLMRRAYTDRFRLTRQSSRLYRQVRITGRSERAVFDAVRAMPADLRTSSHIPVSDSEDLRLRMFEKLRRILRLFGYGGLIVVIDRVDEPLVIGGDPERMKPIVWPMLTSKFLQMESVGIKMLLPIELRHMLFKESAAFFQQARLDKQNLVEQLGWTGSTLFDLCSARLTACRGLSVGDSGKQMLTLADLFDADVGRPVLVEALEQMRQPRDAFKFLYHCIVEHCAQATEDQGAYRIPRRILEEVKRHQIERVRQMAMGVRPA